MLTITVGVEEYFDEQTETFVEQGGIAIDLEHSLVSLSKWEQIFEKPFLAEGEKTTEEVLAYVQCMCLTPNIPPEVFQNLSDKNYSEINTYIDAKMTATWFNEAQPSTRSSEKITSELIYYWLVAFQIPFECQYWHLNRLFTLIKVFNIKNSKPKKMSRAELAERNRTLNAQRRAELDSQG